MKALKFITSLLAFVFVTSTASTALKESAGIPSSITSISMLVLTVAAVATTQKRKHIDGVFSAAVEVEYWVDYIVQRLRKDNQFLQFMFDEGQYVVNGSVVHIPQPGSRPTVVKNRSSFPASTVRRTDTDITYVLDEYTTDPTHIQDAEKVQLSYDKINDVLGDHMNTLTEVVGDDLLIKILAALPSGFVQTTTGGGASTGLVSGQTGTRKVMLPADLKRAQLLMNLNNVPRMERYALLESNMLDQLTSQLDTNSARDFSRAYDAATGIVGELYGFKIMERSNVAVAASAYSGGNLAVNALGAATGATDDVVSVCWQKNSVAKAMGDVKFFDKTNDPQFYGDVYSSLVRMGARRRRADNFGVVAIKGAA